MLVEENLLGLAYGLTITGSSISIIILKTNLKLISIFYKLAEALYNTFEGYLLDNTFKMNGYYWVSFGFLMFCIIAMILSYF